tara:strand:+ start:308 stop:475 length:168 start_codon:yes stop_codon:yes gene_type:complete
MRLQQQKNGQYTITLPKDLVIGFGWSKGTELDFKILGQHELKVRKKQNAASNVEG